LETKLVEQIVTSINLSESLMLLIEY